MSNPTRRALLTTAAVTLPAVAAAGLPAVTAAAVSPSPDPVFDATAFHAKLDELGPSWLLDVAADILESCDEDAPGDGLNTPSYRKKMAERLRDAVAGRQRPDRWNEDPLSYVDDDEEADEPETEAERIARETLMREHPDLIPPNAPPFKRYTREELEKINTTPLKLRPRSKWNVDPDDCI